MAHVDEKDIARMLVDAFGTADKWPIWDRPYRLAPELEEPPVQLPDLGPTRSSG